jgi:hypothetical protein
LRSEPSEVIELDMVSEPALGQEDVLISMSGPDESVGLSVRPWHFWHPGWS